MLSSQDRRRAIFGAGFHDASERYGALARWPQGRAMRQAGAWSNDARWQLRSRLAARLRLHHAADQLAEFPVLLPALGEAGGVEGVFGLQLAPAREPCGVEPAVRDRGLPRRSRARSGDGSRRSGIGPPTPRCPRRHRRCPRRHRSIEARACPACRGRYSRRGSGAARGASWVVAAARVVFRGCFVWQSPAAREARSRGSTCRPRTSRGRQPCGRGGTSRRAPWPAPRRVRRGRPRAPGPTRLSLRRA